MTRIPIVLLLAAVAAAADPAWDWLPRAADDDRTCELHLAAGSDWSAAAADGLEAARDGGQLVLRFEPRQVPRVAITGPAGHHLGVRLVEPGKAAGLATDDGGRLAIGDDRAILAVPRKDAVADRRWGILRLWHRDEARACRQTLAEPEPADAGIPALTRQVAAAQRLTPSGGVLVMLSGDDRFAGWKHREYRQALAWLVADLTARGATHVVLVEPACPRAEEAVLAPLRAQVRDVATAFRCTAVDTVALGEHRLWESSPGVLGAGLNQAGRAEREKLLGPWLGVGGG